LITNFALLGYVEFSMVVRIPSLCSLMVWVRTNTGSVVGTDSLINSSAKTILQCIKNLLITASASSKVLQSEYLNFR